MFCKIFKNFHRILSILKERFSKFWSNLFKLLYRYCGIMILAYVNSTVVVSNMDDINWSHIYEM